MPLSHSDLRCIVAHNADVLRHFCAQRSKVRGDILSQSVTAANEGSHPPRHAGLDRTAKWFLWRFGSRFLQNITDVPRKIEFKATLQEA